MKIKYRSNLCAGVISAVCGIVLAALIPGQIGSDYSSSYGITSRTVPYSAAAIFILCGLALTVQSLILKKDTVKELDVKKEGKALAYMAVFVIYLVLFEYSFLIASAFLGVMTLIFTGSKKKSYYLIVVAVILVLYVLFTQVLHVRLK